MKKIFAFLLVFFSLAALGQTPIPFSSLSTYLGNLDSVKVVGLLKSGNVYTNRTFYGIDFVKSRVLYSDSVTRYVTPTSLSATYYNQTQSDLRFESLVNKATNLLSPDNTKYPTTLAITTKLGNYVDTFHHSYIYNDHVYDTLANFPNDSSTRVKSLRINPASSRLSDAKVITDSTISHTIDVVEANLNRNNLGGGALTIANGGTNAITANAALNNILPSQTGNSTKFLQTDGSNTSWSPENDPVFVASYVHGITSIGAGLNLTSGQLASTITQYTDALAKSALNVAGGTTGQVLKKNTNADYDYSWNTDNTSAGGLSNAYDRFTDGSVTATASSNDIFKFRSANNLLSVAVGSNDPTHGDNLLLTINQANLSIAESQVSSLTADLAGKVPTSTTVNGHALSGNIAVTTTDLNLNNLVNSLQVINAGGALSYGSGLFSARPTVGTANRFYYATDQGVTYFDNGTTWVIAHGALSGDITSPVNSLVTTLATVNANVFGSNTLLKFSVNGKGLVTGAASVVAGDIPTLNQNTTGSAASISGTNVITNSNLSQMAAHTYKGNNTGGTANALDLTQAQLTAELNTFTTSLNGLVPAPISSNTTDFLRRDGSWAAPSSSGMTNPMTTLGDIIVENSTPAPARLAGSTSATKQFLTQTGNGSISAMPGWNTIAAGDVPTLNQNTTGTADHVSGTNVITNSNLSQMATNTIKGNNTGGTANALDLTASQVKTLLAIAESDVANLTTDLNNKQAVTTVATGLTSAGTTQGTALVLSGSNSNQEITTAASGTGVQLPVATATSSVMVVNRGANAIIVYPATSGTINAQSANTGYTLPVNASITFTGKSTTGWYTSNSFQNGDANTTDGSSQLLIGSNKVTYAKMQQPLTATILGNPTGSTANVSEITLGATFAFSGQALQTAAMSGDITTPANSFVTTIGANRVLRSMEAQGVSTSVIGVTGGSTANVADIQSTVNDTYLGRINGALTFLPLGGLTSMTATSGAINTTETNLASYTIAANTLLAGTTFKVVVYGTCTSTVGNASNIRVRLGTAGTSSDAVVAVVTPTAATSGTSIPFQATFLVTILTTGSGGTMQGNGNLDNNGVTGISASADVVGTPQTGVAVNTTVSNVIHVSYVSAATTTTSTFHVASIELVKY